MDNRLFQAVENQGKNSGTLNPSESVLRSRNAGFSTAEIEKTLAFRASFKNQK
jgi:hypothetical protein